MKIKYGIIFFGFLIVFSFFSLGIHAQNTVVSKNGETYRYFQGTSEPDANWMQKSFNDNSWNDGLGVIGYGYSSVTTETDHVTSVYLRIPFTIEDKSQVEDLSLRVMLDDGFVAYLNGTEIARLYMGETGTGTSYDQLADRSQEAELAKCYLIDSALVHNLLADGENVLAIEVHNDSINGSDLLMNAYLYDISREDYAYNRNGYNYKMQIPLDSTLLPILVFNTEETDIYEQNKDYKVEMGIIYNGDSIYNHPDDSFNVYNGPAAFEIRGRSSRQFPKRSFNVEIIDENWDAKDVSLLGLPEDNDFVLFAPFADRSLFRNPMVFDLGRRLGEWSPRSRFCEVIYNGEYVGVYSFMEKIKRGDDRLDIAKLKDDEISGVDLTGGYIFRIDGGGPTTIQVYYPKSKNVQEEQTSYINHFYDTYYEMLYSNDFLDPLKGYWKYVDTESLVDYVIINELTKNCDAYMLSFFMNKNKDDNDGKIHFGPLWDYDLCFGNATFQNGHVLEGWQFEEPTNDRANIKRLFQDTELVKDFQKRWSKLREGPLHLDSLNAMIDNYVDVMGDAVSRNYEVWPVLSGPIFGDSYIPESYDDEITIIKKWIVDRVQWMDENIGDIYYDVEIYTPDKVPEIYSENYRLDVYPNPFSSSLDIQVYSEKQGALNLELINLYGDKIQLMHNNVEAGNNSFTVNYELADLPSGIYILKVIFDDSVVITKRLVKE